jgi:glycosyltransferase involved in cell wall biosynthesis
VNVALVHDYLTQKGGAERVVLSMLKAFPDASLYTSLYEPKTTFAEFAGIDVRPMGLNRAGVLRRHHRLALPLLARGFDRLHPDADVLLCSSSGWAHGAGGGLPKVVYCYAPARWLYQTERYVRGRRRVSALALRALSSYLERWDVAAARTARAYVTSSKAMQDAIQTAYGLDAELLPPPQTLDTAGSQRPVPGVEPGFVLCVSRLLPYKNVDAVVDAFAAFPDQRLVIVGSGPDERRLRPRAGTNVRLVGSVRNDELRWLYASSRGIVTAAYEDFGLTPLEAAAFGKPAAAIRYGGFLDTVRPGETGVFIDRPEPEAVRTALRALFATDWDEELLRSHAARYSEAAFVRRLREIVAETARAAA